MAQLLSGTRVYGTATIDTQLLVNGGIAATSTATGSLIVFGGAGISGNVWVGGTMYGNISGTITGVASTASNLEGGTTGQVPYQTAPGITGFYGPGTAGQLLVSAGASAPVYINTSSIYVGNAQYSNNLRAGTAGSLPYQTGANATSFLSIGSAGTVLLSTGSAPSWITTGTLYVGYSANSDKVKTVQGSTDATHYLTFVDSDNSTAAYETVYTDSGISYNPNTNSLTIGGEIVRIAQGSAFTFARVSADNSDVTLLRVDSSASGSVATDSANYGFSLKYMGSRTTVDNSLSIFADNQTGTQIEAMTFQQDGQVRLNAGTDSSSTSTGNLVVVGGVGINKALSVGSNLKVYGTTEATSTVTGSLQVQGGAGIGGNVYSYNIYPRADNTGVVGDAANTWANGQFTNLTIDSTLNVRAAIDLADSDVIRFGSSDDARIFYNGTDNTLDLELETTANSFNITDNGTDRVIVTRSTGVVAITTNTNSSASTSGALVVTGGVGIGGNLYVGGVIYGTVSVSGSISTSTNLAAGTAGQVPYQTGPGTTSFYGPGTAGQLLVSNGTNAPVYTNTGSIYVGYASIADDLKGGAAGSIPYQSAANTTVFLSLSGTAKSLLTAGASAPAYVTQVQAQNGTASNTATTGQSLVVTAGGLGVTGNSYVAGSVGISTDLKVSGSTNATNQTTGALQVVGGAGFGGDIYAAGGDFGNIKVGITGDNEIDTSTGNLTIDSAGGTVTIDDNLVISGNLTVSGTTTYVDSTVTNVSDPILTLGGGVGGAAPTADDNKDRGIAFRWHTGSAARVGFIGYDDSTGFLTFIPNATITNEIVSGTKGAIDAHLAGGSAQAVVYQSAANTTAFLAAGTAGQLLQTNGTGSAPTWVTPTGLTAGSSQQVATVTRSTNATHYLTFVDSNNASATYESVYTDAGVTYNPSTNALGIGTTPGTANLSVNGAATGTTAGNQSQLARFYSSTGNSDYLEITNTRTANGTSWTTAGFRLQQKVDSTWMGWMQFNTNTANGGIAWGTGTSTGSATAISQRMMLTSSGQLVIGSTSAFATSTVPLYVNGGSGGWVVFERNSKQLYLNANFSAGNAAAQISTVSGQNMAMSISARETLADLYLTTAGNVGVGTTTPGYKLEVNGSFAATTKSFLIDHPTKPGMKLRYGSLEGPENGVYVRGRLQGGFVIELPDYWTGLVDSNTITVNLTAVGKPQGLYVARITENKIVIGADHSFADDIDCFYTVFAERKDVEKLEVEIE